MPISADKSIFGLNGRLLFCSTDRFIRDICQGNNCFICGRSERKTAFNGEHILPNWLLHRFNLHSKSMTFPNGEKHRYGTYKLPCCVECNQELSVSFEGTISEAFASGFVGVEALLEREGVQRLFLWMTLIYLKLHLKDRLLRKHLDPRRGHQVISDLYGWEGFHHVHCLARAHHAGIKLNEYTTGSILLLQLVEDAQQEDFDVVSVTDAATIFLRAGDVAVYVVINDGGACLSVIQPVLDRITGPLSIIQSRELAAELAIANLHLINRPKFQTNVSDEDGADIQLTAILDPSGPRFLDKDPAIFERVKYSLLNHILDNIKGKSREEAAALLKENSLSFLFDDDGNFITDSWQPSSVIG